MADYCLRRQGYLRRLYRNQLATLKALHDGDIDFAYLWANVGWTLHTSPEFKLQVVPGYVPVDHWNIAVAMRAGNHELKKHVDEALEQLIADGSVARALARYHLPYYPPFPEPTGEGQGSVDQTIRHPVADRGPEPQMQKVATSRHPYSALERIRSAGELVVGLDQNNLPFSTAHPKSAGLDYEVASLLAEHLGVPLRVYWAYSSHDSYPSKLASKQLCDVILGVTPDDRFGKRVLYSRPYYVARYEIVVRCGTAPPMPEEPLAVEQGVAVRGLNARKTVSYPSTEAILEAVAAGRVRAGLVISTRGRWLATERWPGKLEFRALEGADRLSISAAVRKTDADLKAAIDQAWDVLERSGRLKEVFGRWHIPYHAGQSAGTPR
jgi:ABC-type amino acid transport substrate-binding protein